MVTDLKQEREVTTPAWWPTFLLFIKQGHNVGTAYKLASGTGATESSCSRCGSRLLKTVRFKAWREEFESKMPCSVADWQRQTVTRAIRGRVLIDKSIEQMDELIDPVALNHLSRAEGNYNELGRKGLGIRDEKDGAAIIVNVAGIVKDLGKPAEKEALPALDDQSYERFLED